MQENLGRRIAGLRNQLGWTQQDLADRVGISRVAVSHLESGIRAGRAAIPGERTVTMIAGLFKLEPHELVAGTSYPAAKAERLPVVACRYTEVEMQLRLLEHDLERGLTPGECADWEERLRILAKGAHDRAEREAVRAARHRLR